MPARCWAVSFQVPNNLLIDIAFVLYPWTCNSRKSRIRTDGVLADASGEGGMKTHSNKDSYACRTRVKETNSFLWYLFQLLKGGYDWYKRKKKTNAILLHNSFKYLDIYYVLFRVDQYLSGSSFFHILFTFWISRKCCIYWSFISFY